MFLCSTCNIIAPCVLDVNVKGQIVPDKSNLLHVDVIVKKYWIQPLIGLDEVEFVSMHLGKKLKGHLFVEGHLNL
jgi:hypothetical protein